MEDDGLIEHRQAIDIHIGGLLLIKGFPCKVVERAVSKPGKHGGAKIHFVGIDIFTQRKYDTIYRTGDNVDVPIVTKQEYTIMNINDEEPPYLSLMSKENVEREDIQLPQNEMGEQIRDRFNDGDTIIVVVQKAMGQEMVISYKIDK